MITLKDCEPDIRKEIRRLEERKIEFESKIKSIEKYLEFYYDRLESMVKEPLLECDSLIN